MHAFWPRQFCSVRQEHQAEKIPELISTTKLAAGKAIKSISSFMIFCLSTMAPRAAPSLHLSLL